jgi:hypothetical protein
MRTDTIEYKISVQVLHLDKKVEEMLAIPIPIPIAIAISIPIPMF